jgi:hypothetical protein
MASTIFFNGRVIATPGSYSQVDASGLEQVGLGASGIVAVVGTAEGGVPASAYSRGDQLVGFTTPDRVRRTFRSGDLREACSMVFEPSRDPQIVAGAQVVVPVKVNPATRSNTTLSAAAGTSVLLTSQDYGAFTSQVNVALANGSTSGRLVTVVFEATTEATDNVGGESMFSLNYVPPVVGGWETMTLQVLSDRLRARGTRTDVGMSTDITDSTPDTLPVQVAASAANAGVLVTVYGNTALANAVRETVTISGVAAVAFTTQFTDIFGAELSAPVAAASTVEIVDSTSPTPDTLISFAAGDQYQGVVPQTGFFVANTSLLLSADGATTDEVHLWGLNASGVAQSERVVMAGTAGVRTSSNWSRIDRIVLGDIAAARTVTIRGVAAESVNSVQSSLQRMVDYFNARQVGSSTGFVAELLDGSPEMNPSRLDLTASTSGTNIFNQSPVVGFTADVDALVSTLNSGSALVTAERIAFAAQIRTLSFTVTNTTTYTATIDGTACSYTSDGSATAAEIQAGVIAAINNNTTVSGYVVASAGSTSTTVVVTGLTPNTFTLAATNMTFTSTQALAGVGQMPSNTVVGSPVFLSGGAEGTATFSDWQNALNLLRQRRVNTVVVLTGDPAVHAELEAHCAYMCGAGRSERDGCIGLSALDGNGDPLNTLPTSTSIRSQIRDLNSRHLRAFAQTVDRYNTSGERETFQPWFLAVLAAGMQAGSTVGTSLTHKYVNVLGHAQHSSWNPVEDGEELIQSGLCFIEEVPSIGRRFVRNVTTYLTSNNIAYTEASVNEAVNYAVFEFRSTLEAMVGRRGTQSNVNALRGIASNKLSQLLNEGIIVAWRALSVTLNVDVMEVSVELAPVIPVNFVRSTIYLNTLPQTAT